MNQQEQVVPQASSSWCWPIDPESYDRNPALSEAERVELHRRLQYTGHKSSLNRYARATLHRLLQPLDDALALVKPTRKAYDETVRVMLVEMYQRDKTFWAWSEAEWREIMGSSDREFAQRWGWQHEKSQSRRYLPVLAYLLKVIPTAYVLAELVQITPLTHKIFSPDLIDEAVKSVLTTLCSWGYRKKGSPTIRLCVGFLLLQNGSPYLSDLSIECLETVDRTCTLCSVQKCLWQVSRALHALGIIERALPSHRGKGSPIIGSTDGSLDHEWLMWCERWRQQSTIQASDSTYYPLLKVGRWLKAVHPEITSPEQWTTELAAEFIAAVTEMKVGEWSAPAQRSRLARRLGQPLLPGAKAKMITSMRVFVRDCQEWGWIRVQMNPHRAFRTPRSLRNLIGPNPRVVDSTFWAKILWAAMNLEAKDLPHAQNSTLPIYPLEMVRAMAVVWCFAALRSDEIGRLRVGCIRGPREDIVVPDTGEILPRDATCFLDIPVNKTMTAYTKPIHPLVGKRINAWEQIRPKEQQREIDPKTGEPVQFLFSYRGQTVADAYINHSLIPLLCRRAGVPLEDSRGKITSHRARATIASMLYNAKEPLSIFELKEYLGHKKLSSTQHYLGVDPTKLASKVAKAGYLEQNLATIEVLLDQEAVMSGAASRGETWKYYDLGHGFCTNPFWAQCAHRMACARCPFYRPKHTLKDQLVEGKANLVHMLEFIALTEDEKVLVTEGIELHQELIERLADVPTPAGPTPRELQAERKQETKVIPLTSVRRTKNKKSNEP
jgi:integrase